MGKAEALSEVVTDVWAFLKAAKNTTVNATTTSLTQYTRDTNVYARAYIDYGVTGDDICIPLLGMLNQMYVALVITALNLDSFCASGRTVSDVVRKVASEQYNDVMDVVGVSTACEHVGENTVINEFLNARVIPRSQEKEVLEGIQLIETPSMEAGPIDLEKESQRLVTGRLIELDMTTGTPVEDNKLGNYGTTKTQYNTFKLYIYVQIFPTIIPMEVARGFLNANFLPTLKMRWNQVKAGEIRFWKDFVFAQDLIERQAEAMKKDKTGIIAGMVSYNTFKWIKQMFRLIAHGEPSRNLANSFLIVSKDSFRAACQENGIDFTNYLTRQKFFLYTCCMMLLVVDPMSGMVDMYINGFKLVGQYNYAMINKVGSKSKDSFDLKEVMQAMNAGNVPRF